MSNSWCFLNPKSLILFGALLYGCCLGIGFISDDFILMDAVRGNDLDWLSAFPAGSQQYWRPMVLLSLDWTPTNAPAVHHLINLGIHLGCTWFVLACGLRLEIQAKVAVWGALWFNIHWANVTNVYWISGRTDSLCALFFLWGLWSFLTLLKKPTLFWTGSTLVGFVFALLSKENSVVFLPVCLGLFWLQRQKLNAKSRRMGCLALAGVLGLTLTYGLFLLRFQYGSGAVLPAMASPENLLQNAAKNLVIIVSPMPAYWIGQFPRVFFGVAGFCGLLALIWFWQKRQEYRRVRLNQVLLLLVLGLATMAPSLIFLQNVAPRLLYLPLGLVPLFLGRLLRHYPILARNLFASSCLLMLPFTVSELVTWHQNAALAKRCSSDFAEAMFEFSPHHPLVILGAPSARKEKPVFGNDMNHALFFATYGYFGRFQNGSAVGQIGWPGGDLVIEALGQAETGTFERRIAAPAAYQYDPNTIVGDVFAYGSGATKVLAMAGSGQVRHFRFEFLPEFLAQKPLVFDFNGRTLIRIQ